MTLPGVLRADDYLVGAYVAIGIGRPRRCASIVRWSCDAGTSTET